MANIHTFTQVLANQDSMDKKVHVNPNASSTISKIKEFMRRNPPTFFVSNMEEDPQGFIDEVFKALQAMNISS